MFQQFVFEFLRALINLKGRYIIPLIFVLMVPATLILSKLAFEYSIESFFSESDKNVSVYKDFKSVFGNENDVLLIGVKNQKQIDKSFLDSIDKAVEELEHLDFVESIESPTLIKYKIKIPFFGFVTEELINKESDSTINHDVAILQSRKHPFRNFISDDASSVQLVLSYSSDLTNVQSKELLATVDSTLKKYNFFEYHLAGRLVTQSYFITQMKFEMKWFGILSAVIFVSALLYFFKSFMLVSAAVLAIASSVIFTFSLIALAGFKVELMMTLMPAILVITGTSLFVHLTSKFKFYFQEGLNSEQAIHATLKEGLIPASISLLTTMVGFGSLMLVPVVPLQLFGFFTALGIFITGILSLLILIPVLKKLKDKEIKQRKKKSTLPLNYMQHRRVKMALIFVIVGIGAVALTQIKSENKFLDDLTENSSLKESLNFFEDNFAGIRPVELKIQFKSGTQEALLDMALLVEKIESVYETKIGISPVSVYCFTNQCLHSGSYGAYQIPTDQSEFLELDKTVTKYNLLNKSGKFFDPNRKLYRLSFRTKDLGSSIHFNKRQELLRYAEVNLPNIGVEFTGISNLIDEMNRNLTRQLLNGLLFSFILITAFLFLITKSLKLALISLVPNIIPLLVIVISMWLFEIPLKIGTATVFTIVLGLAVDDTVHFLVGFRIHFRKTKSTYDAVYATINEYQKPMLHSSLILISGFSIFAFSEFLSISYLGIVVSFSLMIAYLCDIYLLPILLWRSRKN